MHMRGLKKYAWHDNGTRLPLHTGRIVAAPQTCYVEQGTEEQHGDVFRLSDLKGAVEKLGPGQRTDEQIRQALKPQMRIMPTEQTYASALAQLERGGWLKRHPDNTVELT